MSDAARPATAAILTLGCKLNIADSENMARRFRQAGWRVTDRLDVAADAIILNSCSVTHVADQKTRRLLRQARRQAPNAEVALTGCMLETATDSEVGLLDVDLVYKQSQQIELADLLIAMRPAQAPITVLESPKPGLKTRAFISAQEGCNDVCAFCVIPRTRGRERSKTVEAIVAEARAAEAHGLQELVITGTQLGAYGRDLTPASRPYELLSALLAATTAPRIRMSSLQPQDLTNELIGLWRNERLCRHFHLALQSGSEGVLERMRRRYTASQYRDAVQRLREAVPDVAITTDVIVGFPGETEAEFEECLVFCAEMAFAAVHVFPYSQRNHTLAARLSGQVAEPMKKKRVHRLIELAASMSHAYRAHFVGRTLPVLWENQRDGLWEGLTDTYVRVRTETDADLRNRLTPALIVDQDVETLKATVLENPHE